jgi:hypothetical protein
MLDDINKKIIHSFKNYVLTFEYLYDIILT